MPRSIPRGARRAGTILAAVGTAAPVAVGAKGAARGAVRDVERGGSALARPRGTGGGGCCSSGGSGARDEQPLLERSALLARAVGGGAASLQLDNPERLASAEELRGSPLSLPSELRGSTLPLLT